MKRFIVLGLLMIIASAAIATDTWISSFTATADTTQNVCGAAKGYVTNRRGFFHGVCVSSPTGAASTFTVYNSSASAVNPMAVIDATRAGCYYYDVVASTINKGLTYSNSATANVTLLYNCY